MPWKSDQTKDKITSLKALIDLKNETPIMSNSEIIKTCLESKNTCDTEKLLEITAKFIAIRFNKSENLLNQFFLRKKWKKSFKKIKILKVDNLLHILAKFIGKKFKAKSRIKVN